MSGAASNSVASAASWKGEIFAGVVRTRNWTAELAVSQDEFVLVGPLGMRYVLSVSQVEEVRVAVGRFLFWSWEFKNAVRISHDSEHVPSKLAFRSRSTAAPVMLDRLRARL